LYLQAKGQYSKQAHVAIPVGLYEEEFGRSGFYGPVTHLYHQHAPTGWSRIEGPLKPRAFDCQKLPLSQLLHTVPDRVTLLYNEDVSVQIARPRQTHDWYFRNADGDELFFIHEGKGSLETDFGPLSFEEGDYIIIPRGTTYRFKPETSQNFLLVFQSSGQVQEPERGLLGQHALYDPTVIQTPSPEPVAEEKPEWEIKIKRQNQLSSVFYPFNPLDVMGWKGDLTVWKINVRDIRPVMSHRVHLPPSVHSTFVASGFVICTFLPRPLESEPDAVRVPFYHRNIDYDEVIFYHSGNFFSRDGIRPAMVTFHPQGIHHGPHPKAVEASWQKSETAEVAVMIDTVKPLQVSTEALESEWQDYWKSWQESKDPKAESKVPS
jgi:homogentisate 1,2-dioxygenase